MAFAIKRQTPSPHGTNFQTFFYPTFFLLVDQLDYHHSILSTERLDTAVVYLIIHGEESEPSFSMAEAAAKGTRKSEV